MSLPVFWFLVIAFLSQVQCLFKICFDIINVLTSGIKDGYMFEVVGDGNTPVGNYTLTATPESVGRSGRCTFTFNKRTGTVAVKATKAGSRVTVNPTPLATAAGSSRCGSSSA